MEGLGKGLAQNSYIIILSSTEYAQSRIVCSICPRHYCHRGFHDGSNADPMMVYKSRQ